MLESWEFLGFFLFLSYFLLHLQFLTKWKQEMISYDKETAERNCTKMYVRRLDDDESKESSSETPNNNVKLST